PSFSLSLHDALPIYLLEALQIVLSLNELGLCQLQLLFLGFDFRAACRLGLLQSERVRLQPLASQRDLVFLALLGLLPLRLHEARSEEHTSELQSLRQ